MPYKQALKEVFAETGIKRVAIVDDAFDEIEPIAPVTDAVTVVRTGLQDLDDEREERAALAEEIEVAAGVALEKLARNLTDAGHLKNLWTAFAKADPASELAELLRPLFGEALSDRRDKLRPLRALRELLEEMEGVRVEEFGSGTRPEELAEHELIFLDYYLNGDVPDAGQGRNKSAEQAGREASIAFLAKLVELRDDDLPLVMLISSIAGPGDLPAFRRDAKMLASKVNFLKKAFVESDPARAQHVIMALVQHTKQADALAALLKTWGKAVEEASDEMMVSIRELDLTDYSYIQHYRLAGEKTPLGQYIAWLFNGRLTDLVEHKLRENKVEKIVGEFTLPSAIPGRTSPTKAITHLFSSVTTTSIPIGHDGFKPAAWSGDIFLETSRFNQIHRTKRIAKRANSGFPEVLTVITPACDLVPERGIENPLRSVTMIGGTLHSLESRSEASNHLLMLNGKPFVVEWNTKWPLTIRVEAMTPTNGPHGRYQWVGRYRDVYHAELQNRLLQDLGRPALPIAPTMPQYVGVRILARTTKRPAGFEVVLDRRPEDQAAWTWIGKGSGKSREPMFCLREELAWEVRDWVRNRCADLPKAEQKDLRAIIDAPMFIDNLQLPMALKKATGDLPSGTATMKAADPAAVMNGQKALVLVLGTGLEEQGLAA